MFSKMFFEFLRSPCQSRSKFRATHARHPTRATNKQMQQQKTRAVKFYKQIWYPQKQKTWKHILCLKGIIMWYHVRKGVFPTSLAAFFWLGLWTLKCFTTLLAITRLLDFGFTTLPYPTRNWKTTTLQGLVIIDVGPQRIMKQGKNVKIYLSTLVPWLPLSSWNQQLICQNQKPTLQLPPIAIVL